MLVAKKIFGILFGGALALVGFALGAGTGLAVFWIFGFMGLGGLLMEFGRLFLGSGVLAGGMLWLLLTPGMVSGHNGYGLTLTVLAIGVLGFVASWFKHRQSGANEGR